MKKKIIQISQISKKSGEMKNALAAQEKNLNIVMGTFKFKFF